MSSVSIPRTNQPMQNELDSSAHLRTWGFSRSSCMKCGLLNSQVSGMLFQCGKCKKAYYCSAECFNSDLGTHQTYCNTGSLKCEPTHLKSTGKSPEEFPLGSESPARIIVCHDETRNKAMRNDTAPETTSKRESFMYGVVEDIESDEDDF